MAKSKCKWGNCENDAEYRLMVATPSGSVPWLDVCQKHHAQLGEIPVDYVRIEEE